MKPAREGLPAAPFSQASLAWPPLHCCGCPGHRPRPSLKAVEPVGAFAAFSKIRAQSPPSFPESAAGCSPASGLFVPLTPSLPEGGDTPPCPFSRPGWRQSSPRGRQPQETTQRAPSAAGGLVQARAAPDRPEEPRVSGLLPGSPRGPSGPPGGRTRPDSYPRAPRGPQCGGRLASEMSEQ